MNIKRAFLAAAAVLMVPGYAMAQTVNFDTQVVTSNDTPVTVHANLLCNTGNPLEQDADISTTNGGNDFVVDNFVPDDNTTCDITFSNLPAGYTPSIDTNGTGSLTAPHCSWAGANITGGNYCTLMLVPEPFSYTMSKVWELGDAVDVAQTFDITYTCYNVYTSTTDTTLSTETGGWGDEGDASETVSAFYADPDGTTYCTAYEKNIDSSVESDNGCSSPTYFNLTSDTGSCTITNTVFFEGIPTLSQYGLAILAVLMLGVGFVGFRRFV